MAIMMVQRFAVAAVAVAGVLATLGAGSAIAGKGATGGSPFAGKYTGPVPDIGVWGDFGSISVSSGGAIAFAQPPAAAGDWKFSGAVSDDGTFAVTGKFTPHGRPSRWIDDVLPKSDETSSAADRLVAGAVAETGIGTLYFQSSGIVVRGSDGKLHGTTTAGDSFVWVPK
jgi:hypothetical protein